MIVSWAPVHRMIRALEPRMELEGRRLRSAVERSNTRFAPLTDPLLTDFGLHRWLSAEREETYSDWLAWITGQLGKPERVFRMFGIDEPGGVDRCAGARLSVDREWWVATGHVDRAGKLDLLIRFDDRALICVEIKLGPAEGADTAKQVGYRKWLDEQRDIPRRDRHTILLVTEASEPEYPGRFRPVIWSSVCIRLREMVPEILGSCGIVVATMVLAFVGAVEQNLLRFSSAVVQRACRGSSVLVSSRIRKHILESLGEEVRE